MLILSIILILFEIAILLAIPTFLNASVDYVDPDSDIHDVSEDDTEISNHEIVQVNTESFVDNYIARIVLKKIQCTDCQACLIKALCQRDLNFLPLYIILWEFCRFVF